MIVRDANFVRNEIVEELVQRMNNAMWEVSDEHEYITSNEIIIAGYKLGLKHSGGKN